MKVVLYLMAFYAISVFRKPLILYPGNCAALAQVGCAAFRAVKGFGSDATAWWILAAIWIADLFLFHNAGYSETGYLLSLDFPDIQMYASALLQVMMASAWCVWAWLLWHHSTTRRIIHVAAVVFALTSYAVLELQPALLAGALGKSWTKTLQLHPAVGLDWTKGAAAHETGKFTHVIFLIVELIMWKLYAAGPSLDAYMEEKAKDQ